VSVTREEFSRQRAERRRLRELEENRRIRSEAAVQAALGEYHPQGIPDGLLQRICGMQNELIRETVQNEKVIREMHDGVHRIAEEAVGRWLDGFRTCADQIRMFADELDLSPAVVNSLLRNDQRPAGESREERNEAASQQVAWKRG
jgi:hypothetical protein